MMRPRRKRSLSIGQHAFLLQHGIPGATVRCSAGKLEMTASVRPTLLSRWYDLRISYDFKNLPVSIITGPNLGKLTDRVIPHLYRHSPYELCLYYPKNREWNPQLHLARTIFPWSVEWLFHFECWLATDSWDGGGTTHPSPTNEN